MKRQTLRSLRQAQGITQARMAKRIRLSQSALSRFERSPDHYATTLRRYIEALGGTLEIHVLLAGRNHRLRLPEAADGPRRMYFPSGTRSRGGRPSAFDIRDEDVHAAVVLAHGPERTPKRRNPVKTRK